MLVPISKTQLVPQAHAAAPVVHVDFHCGEWGTKFLSAAAVTPVPAALAA